MISTFIEHLGRRVWRLGVLFGKRVGSFTLRAGEIISGELDASARSHKLPQRSSVRGDTMYH